MSAQPEVVLFPDAEALVVGFLNAELSARGDSARASTRVPAQRPDRFVRVSLAGGTRANLAQDTPMLTFECWDKTSPAASDLCRLVRALVWSMPGRTDLAAFVFKVVEVGGPQFFPDPNTTLPRYQFTAQLRVGVADIL